MQTPHPADKTVELPCPGSLGLPTDSGSTELRLLSPHPPEDSSQVPNKAFSSLVTRQPSASHSQCAFYFLRDRATSRIKAFGYNSIHASDAAYRGNTGCSRMRTSCFLQSSSWTWQYKKLLLVTNQPRAHVYHWDLDGPIWQASAKRLRKSHYVYLPLFSSSQGKSLSKNNSC